jgi:uncharacterized protein YkwD
LQKGRYLRISNRLSITILALTLCLILCSPGAWGKTAAHSERGVKAGVGGPAITSARTEDDIRARWGQLAPKYSGSPYQAAPSVVAPYAPGSASPGLLEDGLNTLNFARYLAGLPDVSIDPVKNTDGQYGSVLLAASEFSHSPPKPGDMSQDFYNRGLASVSSSNIGAGYSDLAEFERSCLDDVDSGNIERLGHRRWLLNPKLLVTGIGYAQEYCTTSVFDQSGGDLNYGFVAWPSAGLFPTSMFSSQEAWSITLDPARYQWDPNGAFQVNLRRLGDGRTWSFDRSNTDQAGRFFNADFQSYGVNNCFIFRPEPSSVTYQAGDEFEVALSGAITDRGTGGPAVITYRTRFMSLSRSTYYFAEGYTGDNFSEYLCLGNPDGYTATTNVTYMFPDGTTREAVYRVPANSRITVNVNSEVGPGREVSMRVSSDTPNLLAERPMYFNYLGQWSGGSAAVGVRSPAKQWYFAEGTTLPGFDEYVTVQNPGTQTANLTFHYMVEKDGEQDFSGQVGPNSRATFKTRDQVGDNRNVSLHLESDQDIVAERPMYFNYRGLAGNDWTGGHDVVGANFTANSWYFAEGTTRAGFEEWLCLQNPNSSSITVNATYQLGPNQGKPVTRTYKVPARQRRTVSVNKEIGADKDCSVYLNSLSDFIAERPMYFLYHGAWTGGHNVMGANKAATTWSFAEGYTGGAFEEWLCVQNREDDAANVTVTYFPQSGGPFSRQHIVGPDSRLTINVNDDAGRGLELSARVTSDRPVVVERPMYFDYYGWTGGHDVAGFTP